MADVQFAANVEQEVKTIFDALLQEAKDIKAKAPTATLLSDGLPLIVTFASSYASLSADVKSAEAYAYIGYTLGAIVGVFVATTA